MKKLSVLLLAALMVCVLSAPVLAFENEFGGYWRARFFTQRNFTGEDQTKAQDVSRADSRTRLFYTAHFSDDFKFINKFEMNAIWGDTSASSYGDISADGIAVQVKNTYADFSLGSFNFKVGTQPKVMARGFIFDDDFSGIIARYVSDTMIFPLIWMRAYEGGTGDKASEGDVEYLALDPRFKLGENVWLNPLVLYIYSGDASGWASLSGNKAVDVWFLGASVDAKFDFGSVWFTGIYETGTADDAQSTASFDVSAYLVAAGASVQAGPAEIHGQIIFASGDDNLTDKDAKAFFMPQGQKYYWAEIMGYGFFDNQASAHACADQISNLQAFNIGVSYSPMEKLTLTLDGWYAQLAEDDANGNKDLGTEVDLDISYKLLQNLQLDVVGAYLFAGDATYTGPNSADPYELGIQLSFMF
jgi:hypothetical protein